MNYPAASIRYWTRTVAAAACILCLWSIATLACARGDAGNASMPSVDKAALGRSVFFANWVPKGSSGDHVGLGPLYNATSCNACHEGGYGAQGPTADGLAPVALVIHLATQGIIGGGAGDPTYGRIFNTSAKAGAHAEGVVRVSYTELAGYYYPFGPRWVLRVPHYHLQDLAYGPLAPDTIIKPRIAPTLFGVGILEAMPVSGPAAAGRLGWQADQPTIRAQTTVAAAFDMGITSSEQPQDDCTGRENACGNADSSEISPELLDALVEFERTLPVPAARSLQGEARGNRVFGVVGCAACHRDQRVTEPGPDDKPQHNVTPYTDLRLHNLGLHMADENAAGKKVPTQWRTAPLWGIAHRLQHNPAATFLHDGRARSTEEAILWHGGEAAKATRAFTQLGTQDRALLLSWINAR